MFKILKEIKDRRAKSSKYNFNTGLNSLNLELFESAFIFDLNSNYKTFIKNYDGGMILMYENSMYIDMTDWEADGPKQSTFYFYSFDEVVDNYQYNHVDRKLLPEKDTYISNYPFIPICNGPEYEEYFLCNEKYILGESPVIRLLLIYGVEQIEIVAKSFKEFIDIIVKNNGFPPSNLLKTDLDFEVFSRHNRLMEYANSERDESLKQLDDQIKLYPSSSWYLTKKAIRLFELKDFKNSLIEIEKAIKMDRDSYSINYYYSCRANNANANYKKALEDINKAIEIEPKEPLYLLERAKCLALHKRYNEAIKDIEEVLVQDCNDYSAKILQEKILKKL